MRPLVLLLALFPVLAQEQPRRVLYVTHSAGYRHDCLPLTQRVLQDLANRSGKLEISATEDLSTLSDLSRYNAVVFFTSGELALSPAQKQNLLTFVRNGGGFAGFHSATDTLYTWPEYGELIGGRFDGHPWTQQIRVDVEDIEHPATRHLPSSFVITDEIYQFREFSRGSVRVLMTLDTTSVDPRAPGVNRTDNDFALTWTKLFGSGRVFYSALGHLEETWLDSRFQQTVEQALLWITGQVEGDGAARAPAVPSLAPNGIGNAATMTPAMTVSPGALISVYGAGLTSGATMSASNLREPARRLAGTRVLLNGQAAPLLFASPQQINLLTPLELDSGIELQVEVPNSPPVSTSLAVAATTPGIFITTVDGTLATLWTTGLGAVHPAGSLFETNRTPRVTVNGQPANVSFSGLAPGWLGLYQVNIRIPVAAEPPYRFALEMP